MAKRPTIRIDCRECPYTKRVNAESDEMPADYLIEHGTETGHTLDIDELDDPEVEA
jgi:hypothetical protein